MVNMEEQHPYRRPLELWGGIECSRVRVGDQYHDQTRWTGHDTRVSDLETIAALGIRTLRYPALWEQACPSAPDTFDWRWADERLPQLRRLNIRPIVGLVHHGSGPIYTHLLDPDFPALLASYARALTQRFPWLDAFTPINEPLTTARFSALYGHWYPHRKDGLSFSKALLTECRAVVLAMQAIRQVRPDAELVQTEDMGTVYATRRLKYQADFENERRWITFDLLCGRVDNHHPIGSYLLWLGVPESELKWFQDHRCPPNIVGLNHYVTSNRFLDQHIERYPEWMHGGNGRHRYVDVEAVRTRQRGLDSPTELLLRAWQRYQLPLAITESHLGCTREEQARWLWYVWQCAQRAQARGADVRAVTSWALLGVYDWDRLMTQPRGYYESGALNICGSTTRITLVGKVVKDLANGRRPMTPVIKQRGWWQRPDRLFGAAPCLSTTLRGRSLLIAGGNGTLGQAFKRICGARSLKVQPLSRAEMDIADPQSVKQAIETYRPWGIINASGYVRVDQAESEAERCARENTIGASVLAETCSDRRLPLLTFSTDLVFDGTQNSPYCEPDKVNPLSVYGRTKAQAERHVLEVHPASLVVRTSAFFGPWDQYNFITQTLQSLRAGHNVAAAEDLTVTPTYVPDLVQACLDLLLDGAEGIWHVAGPQALSWAEFGAMAARRAGLSDSQIERRPAESFGWPARRPSYSALASKHGLRLPDLDNAFTRYLGERL